MPSLGIRPVILAGGGATRFGGKPKGLEIVGGRRIVDRLAAVMTDAFGIPPLLVANAPDAATWRPDLRVVPDTVAGAGALGGIYTAVVEGPAPVVVAAWDMPFVPQALLLRLAAGLDEADAVLPASAGRRGVEPLCAAYGPACREAIAESIESGDLRAVAFHDRLRVDILSLDAVRSVTDPERAFFNVNTADDLERAEALWRHESFR